MAYQLQHGFKTEQPSFNALDCALEYNVREFGIAVDGGAYFGGVAQILAKKFHGVFAFEPNIDFVKVLRKNVSNLDNVRVFDVGLGDKNETVDFVRVHEVGCHVAVDSLLNVVSPGETKMTMSAPLIKLDDIALPRLDFLKLDLEGYETKAIFGAEETIKKFRPVVMVENIFKITIASPSALAAWEQGEQTNVQMKSGYWRRYSEESPTDVLLQWGYRLVGKFDQLDDVLVYDI